jgi:hypothetical protein
MPIRMVIERDTALIRTTASGRVTGQDLVEYYRRLRAHPDFRSNLNEIFDASQVEAVDLTAEDVRRLSGITEEFTKHGVPVRVAIIAPGDVEFGMSRMYEMLQVQSINVLRVFRDRKAAEEWLFDEDQ